MSIRTKLQLSITGVMLLVCAGALFIFYFNAREALLAQIRSRLAAVANGVALQIDASAHDSLHARAQESTPAYRKIKAILQKAKAGNPDIRFIYTMRPAKPPSIWEFVVDAETDPDTISHIGDHYDVTQYPELVAGLSRPTADADVLRDKWGELISGYAPIRDNNGRPVGIVGVDMSAKQLSREMAYMRRAVLLSILLAALLALVLGSIISSLMLSPIEAFIKRLDAAAHGDLETLADDRRNDEIGKVARTFNAMVNALRHKDQMLSEMNTDYLTGLHNHRYFQQRLQEEICSVGEKSGQVALLMLDLDKFKRINDTFGHAAGDEILKQLAKLLATNTSHRQSIARYGGEEFAVVLPNSSLEDAVALAEHLRRIIAAHPFEIAPDGGCGSDLPDGRISMTVSIGAAVYPVHSKERDGLIMAANIALCRAKHLGRDRVRAFNSSSKCKQDDPYHVYTFIQDPSKSAIEALAAAVDARDHYTRNHSENVSKYAHIIGEHLGLKESEMELLRMASLLHDVGKIGVPDYVLNKPSGLTQEEMEVIRTHPAVGESIVRNSRNLDAVLPGILYHHEYFNGCGYPFGLSGEEIPLIARIISVADAFDALTTDRPYRSALSVEKAIDVLKKHSGTQFDPDIVAAFVMQIETSRKKLFDHAA